MATLTLQAQFNSSTLTDWKSWAQLVNTAMTAFGWVQVSTDTPQVNWSTVQLPNTALTAVNSLPPLASKQISPDPSFVGSWSQGHGAYSQGNTVTDNGTTYYCTTGYTPNSTSAVPQYDTTHWCTWAFEIWRPASSALQTNCPIFLRFEYGMGSLGAVGPYYSPYMRVGAGTAITAGGQLNATGTNARVPLNAYPSAFNNLTFQPGFSLTCRFSADSQNRFAMVMFEDVNRYDTNTHGSWCYAVERSLTNEGVYTSDYWTLLSAGFTLSAYQTSVLTTAPLTFLASTEENIAWATVCCNAQNNEASSAGATVFDGMPNWGAASSTIPGAATPAWPVFPLVGWVGNPMTCMVVTKGTVTSASSTKGSGDAPDGPFTVAMYGTTHTYLGIKNQDLCYVGQNNTNNLIAMRFE